MLAFFVPTFLSPHLPSSINTPFKVHCFKVPIGGWIPPVENQICLLRGSENCARLGLSRPSRCCFCSLWPIKRTSSPMLVFLCLLSSYAVSPCGLLRSSFKKSKCTHRLSKMRLLIARLNGISYGRRCSASVSKKPAQPGGFFVPKILCVVR